MDLRKEDGLLWRLHNSFYFVLCLRAFSVILTLITLIICVSSQHWMNKMASVAGLFFTIIAFIMYSCSIGAVYMCKLRTSALAKRALFVFVGALCSLASAVLYILAIHTCDQWSFHFGCSSSYLSTGMQVAAAFAFLCLFCSCLDFGLQLLFNHGSQPESCLPPAQSYSPASGYPAQPRQPVSFVTPPE
ncbi:unnamed protein product, partial [Mesorhabditis spiculigera]